MKREFETIVIGAMSAGLSTSYHLTRSHRDSHPRTACVLAWPTSGAYEVISGEVLQMPYRHSSSPMTTIGCIHLKSGAERYCQNPQSDACHCARIRSFISPRAGEPACRSDCSLYLRAGPVSSTATCLRGILTHKMRCLV
jgi:hypothetical protein